MLTANWLNKKGVPGFAEHIKSIFNVYRRHDNYCPVNFIARPQRQQGNFQLQQNLSGLRQKID